MDSFPWNDVCVPQFIVQLSNIICRIITDLHSWRKVHQIIFCNSCKFFYAKHISGHLMIPRRLDILGIAGKWSHARNAATKFYLKNSLVLRLETFAKLLNFLIHTKTEIFMKKVLLLQDTVLCFCLICFLAKSGGIRVESLHLGFSSFISTIFSAFHQKNVVGFERVFRKSSFSH